jgi:hypothetical protein
MSGLEGFNHERCATLIGKSPTCHVLACSRTPIATVRDFRDSTFDLTKLTRVKTMASVDDSLDTQKLLVIEKEVFGDVSCRSPSRHILAQVQLLTPPVGQYGTASEAPGYKALERDQSCHDPSCGPS